MHVLSKKEKEKRVLIILRKYTKHVNFNILSYGAVPLNTSLSQILCLVQYSRLTRSCDEKMMSKRHFNRQHPQIFRALHHKHRFMSWIKTVL